jgi:hypothetical protein
VREIILRQRFDPRLRGTVEEHHAQRKPQPAKAARKDHAGKPSGEQEVKEAKEVTEVEEVNEVKEVNEAKEVNEVDDAMETAA